MLDDWQECFGDGPHPARHSANTTNAAELDEALALLQEQKPLVRLYSTDTSARCSSGDVWIGQIWGADTYAIQQENENVLYYIPEEGAVRGSDTMAIFSGAKHPIAAHLFINHMLDAQVSAANTNYIDYMGPNAAAREFIDPAILEDPALNPDQALLDKLEELLDLGQDVRDEYLTAAGRRSVAEIERPTAATRPAPVAGRPASRRAASLLVVPGVAWLVLFFLVPLAMIFVVSLGTRDVLDRVVLEPLSLDNYARAFDPAFLPTLLNSLRYAAITTILSLAIGYPIAYWISRYGGRRKVLLLILVMLPFWTSYLIRTYAWMIILRDNGVANWLLQAVGLTSEPLILLNTDLSVILGMTYGFLPFAILPLFVSIDRLDPHWWPPRATCTPTVGRVPARHAAADDAGRRRRDDPHVHPGDRRLRDARPARRRRHHDDRQGRPGAVPRGAGLAVRGGPRVHADARDPRRHAARAPPAAPRDRRHVRSAR